MNYNIAVNYKVQLLISVSYSESVKVICVCGLLVEMGKCWLVVFCGFLLKKDFVYFYALSSTLISLYFKAIFF